MKDFGTQNGYHSADASAIAPLNTYTGDEDWRDNLKKGQQIDAMDRTYKWHSATVVVEEERKEGGIMPMVKVGFRVYDPQGDKADEMGAYFGLSAA